MAEVTAVSWMLWIDRDICEDTATLRAQSTLNKEKQNGNVRNELVGKTDVLHVQANEITSTRNKIVFQNQLHPVWPILHEYSYS